METEFSFLNYGNWIFSGLNIIYFPLNFHFKYMHYILNETNPNYILESQLNYILESQLKYCKFGK